MTEVFKPSEHHPGHRPQVRLDSAFLKQRTQEQRLAHDKQCAKWKKESLVYRQYIRRGTLSDFMQRIGDWGRQHLPVVRFRR